MKFFFLFAALFSFSFAPPAAEGHRLTVSFAGLDSSEGTVQICLMNDARQFLKDCYIGKTYDFTRNQGLMVTFKNIPGGDYAIMAYHDEDNDGKLECEGLFGMPSEDYAFSNNPSTFFGPPAQKKCVFRMEADKQLTIRF